MRKNIHMGTKADVFKRKFKLQLEAMGTSGTGHSYTYANDQIIAAMDDCSAMITAGVNPYAAVVAMNTKLNRIVTFNHPWVNQ
ncbi:hypothetical protein [Salmonella phage SP154]|nr:hypothetical protein [Salmonella phage SP154]